MAIVTVTKSAIRDLINEVLDNKTMAKSVMDPFALTTQINPVVSRAAPYDAPLNPNFTPQDKPEFVVAMQRAVQGFEDNDIPNLYKTIVSALEEFGIDPATRIPREAEEDEETKRKATLGGDKDQRNMKNMKNDTKDEALVRAAVKTMILEARPKPPGGGKPTKFGKLPEEEDDPEPFNASPDDYAAWEERQAERERRRALATRGTHEKNIMTDVPQTAVSGMLGMKHSTYVKGEQQLLNKMLSMLLDPTTPKSQREAKKGEYARGLFGMFMNGMASMLSDDDPEMEDPFTLEFFSNFDDPEYSSVWYNSTTFQKWYQKQLEKDTNDLTKEISAQLKTAGSTEEKNTIRAKMADLKRLYRELSELPTSLGAGYSRLDQDPGAFGRLHGLYQSQYGEDDALPAELKALSGGRAAPASAGSASRTGGRKAQAGKAVGKVPAKPPRRKA